MKKVLGSLLMLTSLLAISPISMAYTMDNMTNDASDVVNGTVDATKDVGRATSKAIESTGKATKDVFQ